MSDSKKPALKRSQVVDYSKKYWWVGVIAVPLLLFVLARLWPEKKDSVLCPLTYVSNLTVIQNQYLQVMGQPLSDPGLRSLIEQAVKLGVQGGSEQSIRLYEQAAAQAPIPALLNNLGVQYVRTHQPEQARKSFELALQKDPGYEAARRNLEVLSGSKGPAPPSSRELEGTTISSTTPSSDISSPSPLDLGEVVKGRLGNSDETGKFHFWLVDFPVGSFKIVLDVRRSDLNNSNVGGLVQFFSTDGEKLDLSCAMNQVDYRWRQICGFTVRGAFKSVLRYSNAFTVSDYWLGVFKSDAPVKSPFFDKSPPVLSVKLGQRVTATLDGSQPPERDAWYSLRLRPGDYKLSVEYKRADGQKGNVGGMLNTYGSDGNYSSSANGANDVDFSAKAVSRLSLADDTSMLFRISAAFTKELVTFEIERAKEQ